MAISASEIEPGMRRAAVVAVLSLVILSAGLYLVDDGLQRRALSDSNAALDSRAATLASEIDRILQSRMKETFTFAALPSFRGFATADDAARPARAAVALDELKSIVAADPSVRAASIFDANGVVTLTTDSSMHAQWGNRPFAREALAGHLFGSVPSNDAGEVSLYYSAPLLDNSGDVAGGLVIRVAVEEIWKLAASGSNEFVVDEYGVRIADWSTPPQDFVALAPLAPDMASTALGDDRYGAELSTIKATQLAALARQIADNVSGHVDFIDSNGRGEHAAFRRLATYPWTAVAFESQDDIASSGRQVLPSILVFGVAAVVAGVLTAATFLGARKHS